MAENSPYMEAMKEKDVEVLFCYEQYDDLTMLQLGQFEKKSLKSIENAVQVKRPLSALRTGRSLLRVAILRLGEKQGQVGQ